MIETSLSTSEIGTKAGVGTKVGVAWEDILEYCDDKFGSVSDDQSHWNSFFCSPHEFQSCSIKEYLKESNI